MFGNGSEILMRIANEINAHLEAGPDVDNSFMTDASMANIHVVDKPPKVWKTTSIEEVQNGNSETIFAGGEPVFFKKVEGNFTTYDVLTINNTPISEDKV